MDLSSITKNQRRVGLTMWLAVAVLCTVGLSYELTALSNAHKAVSWPIVQGSIVSSNVVRGGGKGVSYYPVVRYQYVVDEMIYVGQRIAFGYVGCGSEEHASSIVAKCAVQTIISVHFNPDNPSDAVLIVGKVLEETWFGIIFLSLGISVSIGLVFVLYKGGFKTEAR